MSYTSISTCFLDKILEQKHLNQCACTLYAHFYLVHAHFIWAHAHLIHTLKTPLFQPSFTDSLRITLSLYAHITSPSFLDRNAEVVFLVVWNFLKSVHSVHSVQVVCTSLPPDVHVTHTQYWFPQAQDIKQPPLQCFCKHSTYQYVPRMYSQLNLVHTSTYQVHTKVSTVQPQRSCAS